MITCNSIHSQTDDYHRQNHTQCAVSPITETKAVNGQLWFFFGVAPLAVLVGWLSMAVCLTGDWTWELPLGLLFALAGSMTAMVITRLRV